jgi:hypothetical protein
MNIYIRIVATQCSLGTWFVSGICVDTLHKGDTEDDDDNIWKTSRQVTAE